MAVIDGDIIYGRISMQGRRDRAADRRLCWLPLGTILGNACDATAPVIDEYIVPINDGEHASAVPPPGLRPGMGRLIRPGIGPEAVQWPRQGAAEAGEQKSIAMCTNPADPPIQLIDGPEFIRALHRSRKGMLLPQIYKAMCRQCGDIVQHQFGNNEAKRCGNGHFVVPDNCPRRAGEARPRHFSQYRHR